MPRNFFTDVTNVSEEESPPLYRHPLNLPAGSVRTVLVLLILLPFWVLLLAPERLGPVPDYLYGLLAMVLVYFAAHGSSIASRDQPQPGPWHLPGGTFRLLILASTVVIDMVLDCARCIGDVADRPHPVGQVPGGVSG